tara:strand:- start:307 stop:558 length:252 start_codon:yes stop_codon:yes gene_type:complete
MKTDRLQIRGEFLEKEDKPYRSITNERINYTSDYVKWLEDKLVNTINYTHCSAELKSKECPMCNEQKDCEGHNVCEDCGGRSF